MVSRSWDSFVADARLLGRSLLVGLGEICLCPSAPMGAAVVAGLLLLSPWAAVLALAGGGAATLWAFVRQQDARLVETGWYATNGALAGLAAAWWVSSGAGALALTVAGAVLVAWILDRIVFPLGDAPLGLPPLSAPFVVFAVAATLALPAVRGAAEWLAPVGEAPPALARAAWRSQEAWTGAAEERLEAAWRVFRGGQLGEARERFAALAQERPESAEAQNGAGWVAFRLGLLDEAERRFRRALDRDSSHAYAQDGLGWVAFRRGRLGEAWGRFAAAATALPAWADPAGGLGWIAYTRGRYREAEGHFRRALELDPAYADARRGLGWALLQEGRYEEARTWLEGAVAVEPGSPVAREGLGWALVRTRSAREGEAVFLALLSETPARPDALLGIAEARRRLALRGERRAGEPLEWTALGAWVLPVAPGLAAVGLTLVARAPWGALLGLTAAAGGALVAWALAGPAALLWTDLHLQTLGALGLLVGRAALPRLGTLVLWAVVGLAGGAVWVALGWLELSVPLLAFNLVGLASLFVLRRLSGRAAATAGVGL